MIGYYLSSNNEMCYSTKIQTFSRTKQGLKFHTRKKSFFASVGCSAAFAMATRLGNNGSCTRRHYRGSQDPFNFRRVRLDRPIIRDPQQLLPVSCSHEHDTNPHWSGSRFMPANKATANKTRSLCSCEVICPACTICNECMVHLCSSGWEEWA